MSWLIPISECDIVIVLYSKFADEFALVLVYIVKALVSIWRRLLSGLNDMLRDIKPR